MYLDLHIVDFHAHFPSNLPWFADMGPDNRQLYYERRGERRAGIAREQAIAYSKQWRLTWGFDPPESDPPDDDTQADRLAQ